MRLSTNKVLGLLLPFLGMIAGGALPDATTLPSLRIVGSFSVGLEGLSTPLHFSHNLELPLAPLRGQRLLDWSEINTAQPAQPRISRPARDNELTSKCGGFMMLCDDVDSVVSQQDNEDEDAIERSNESKHEIKESAKDNAMQLVLRRPDPPSTKSLSSEMCPKNKRNAAELSLDDEGRATSKRTRLEEDRADAPQWKVYKKRRKERKASKRAKRCRYCRHCGQQDYVRPGKIGG